MYFLISRIVLNMHWIYVCNINIPLSYAVSTVNSNVFYSALVSTCGIGSQLQSGGRLGQNELEPLSSLWNGVIDDLHFYKLVPFTINKMEYL